MYVNRSGYLEHLKVGASKGSSKEKQAATEVSWQGDFVSQGLSRWSVGFHQLREQENSQVGAKRSLCCLWEGEALRAVNQGNGRLMDGFSIKVFLEKRLSTQARKPKVDALREDVQDGTSFYAVIRFEEEEQIPIFWDLKESLLKSWFTDIDTVDNFMNKKKFRVWVRIEGMPLMAWIEEETAKKLRFDGARILLGVSCLSDVPLTAAISFEGESFWLRISIVEFEDESEKLQSEGGFINNLEGVSPRALPNERGDGPTLGETQEDGLDNLGSSQTITLGGSAGAVPLIEVPVKIVSGSFDSSKRSLSVEPVFDPSSGLYSIRPKSLRYLSCLNSFSLGLCLVNNKVGLNNKLGKTGSSSGQDSDKRGLACPRKSLQGHTNSKKVRCQTRASEQNHKIDKEEEARVNLDVCESVGLFFDADRKVILNRLKLTEGEAGC
ncbi:hypothetical protein V6N13_020122 [Hibiscus sabdariffa]